MAEINLGNDTTINATLSTEEPITSEVLDINYIPGYVVAEQERRANEVVRQANEADRIALYNDMEYKLEHDYFKGDKGDPGEKGADAKINGVNTINIVAGDNIEIEQEDNTMTISSTGESYTAGTGIEITAQNVINNTAPNRIISITVDEQTMELDKTAGEINSLIEQGYLILLMGRLMFIEEYDSSRNKLYAYFYSGGYATKFTITGNQVTDYESLDVVYDNHYTHTDNNYTNADKNKLDNAPEVVDLSSYQVGDTISDVAIIAQLMNDSCKIKYGNTIYSYARLDQSAVRLYTVMADVDHGEYIALIVQQNENLLFYEKENVYWVRPTDYASSSTAGVIKTDADLGASIASNGKLQSVPMTYATYTGKGNYMFVSKGTLENVITGKELVNKSQLEERVEKAEMVYNAIPKVTGTGTDLTLDDTAEAPMKLEVGSNTSQGDNPSPSYPQTIQVVKGNNSIKVENKNLISSVTKIGNALYFNDGTSQTNYIFKAGTYTLSYVNANTTSVYVKTASTSSTSLGSNSPRTFTMNEDFNVWIYRSGMADNETSNIQLERNNEATPYVEHKEQVFPLTLGDIEYCKIGDYKDKIFKTTGKNLFNGDVNTYTFTANEAEQKILGELYLVAGTTYYYSYTVETATTSSTRNTPYIKLGSTTTYENTATNYNASKGRKIWQFTPSTTGTYSIGYWCHTPNVNVTIDNFMISTSNDTEYEPYGNGQWYLKKNIGKVVLDGTETITLDSTSSTPTERTIFRATIPFNASATNYIANRFIKDSTTSNRLILVVGNNKPYISIDNTIANINTSDTNAQKIDKFTNWITNNNVIFYTPITPTYTLLNDTLQTQLDNISNAIGYQEQTNISQTNADLPAIINASAVMDLNSLVTRVAILEA